MPVQLPIVLKAYEKLNKTLLDYDMSFAMKGQACDLMEGFQARFNELQTQAVEAIRSQHSEEEAQDFYQFCGADRPIPIEDNIQAMYLVGQCIQFLEALDL